MADITNKTEATELLNTLIKLTECQLKRARFSTRIATASLIDELGKREETSGCLNVSLHTMLILELPYKCLKYDGFGRLKVNYRPGRGKPGSDGRIDILLYERRSQQDPDKAYVKSESVSNHVAFKKTGKTIAISNNLPVASQNYEESLETQLGVLFEMLNNDLYPVVTGEEVFTLKIPYEDWRKGY